MFVLGIDFGTTNTCVSYYDNDKVKVVQNAYGLFTTPSCLYFDTDSPNILYGNAAYNLLESNYNTTYISSIVYNFKRLLGVSYLEYTKSELLQTFFKTRKTNVIKDPDSEFCCIQLMYNNKQTIFTIIEIVSIFLKFIKTETEQYLNLYPIKDIVITIPAYFSDIQRQHLQKACTLAELEILRIINEPVSAALAYAYEICIGTKKNNKLEEHILVIDCGGGTTDFSLLYMDYQDLLFQVVNVHGNNFMGGEDLTQNLIKGVLSKLNMHIHTITNKQLNIIKKECERCKCQLSFNENVVMYFENLTTDKDFSLKYSRTQFYNDNLPFFNKIKSYILKTIDNYTLDKIIFVGGSTRIPRFKQICNDLFGDTVEIYDTLNPDHTVSIGATLQGQLLTSNSNDDFNDSLVLDIVPISLGIETENGTMTHIVSKNTPLPVTKTQLFTNTENDVDSIQIDIYQGERKFVKDNVLLSSFKINALNKTFKRGEMQIKVTFDIDKQGIITVKADVPNNEIYIHHINNIQVKANILKTDEDDIFTKIKDSKQINLLKAKMELYNSYQFLLDVYNNKANHTNPDVIKLFNDTNDMITHYENYSSNQLKEYKTLFETQWHTLMFTMD